MNAATKTLLATLDLEPLEQNLFRGNSPQVGWQRVFGGQVIGQALVAAQRTVEEGSTAHSLHGYFMRPGDPKVPIIYEVERNRDGRSFTTRQVVAIQHGKQIFTMAASFHNHEEGLEHQSSMPDVPQPENLPTEQELIAELPDTIPAHIRNYFERERPIELRRVETRRYDHQKSQDPIQNVWIRASEKLPDDTALHQCILAYASDITLLDTALVAQGRSVFDTDIMLASLDHALWFHRPFRADEWLLYSQDSPSLSGSRGFTRGGVYTKDGVLVASVVQEGLIRLKTSA